MLHSFLLLGAPVAAQAFSGAGQGSSNNPFRVSTCDQLQSIAEDTSAHYALENDIDCSATATWNTNTGFVPISSFGGVLDGRNFTISGLHASPASGNAGLLANLTGAVKNLKLTAEYISGHSASGGLAGSITNGATVMNVSASGDITGGNSVGGLIGYAENSSISRSSATGTITSTVAWAGGLIGYAVNTPVSNSYANTSITGANTSGGLIGSVYVDNGNTVIIENSYAVGTITDLGGRAGFVADSQGTSGTVQYNNDFSIVSGFDGSHVQVPTAPFQAMSGIQVQATNFYFDQDAAGVDACATGFSLDCTPVNTDGGANHYFWGSLTAGPLGAWDFGAIWNTYDNLPYLRDADLDAIDTLSAPSAPQDLTFKGQDGGMNVSWDDPTSNGGSPLRDYSIQMRPSDDDGSWQTLSHSPGYANFIGIGGPANGDYYDVRVAAINDIGIGEYAEIDHTMVGAAPGQVQNFVFTNGVTTLGGSWSAPADPGYSAVDHYQFAFRTTGQSGWATYDVGGLSAGINGVNPGHYDVRVRAVSVNGPGDWSYLNNQYVGSQVYNITTCQELQDIQNDMGGHYTLANDIDCSETSTWNNGSGFSPIGITIDTDFTGSLDGQGHIITGLHEDNSSFSHGPYNLGLFYSTEGATIQNLSINDSTFLGSGDAGAFASYADNTTASNLRSNASVISTITDNVGGLFGSFRGDDDRTQVVLSACAFTGTARGDYLLGGLVGYSSNVTIQDSYVHGTVVSLNGGNYIGGIVGVADNTAITNVYSTAKVESDGNPNASYFGGLAGLMETNSQISNSFAAGSVDTSVGVYGAIVAAGTAAQNQTNVYFDGNETGTHYCAGIGFAGGPDEGPTCTEVNADGTDPNYFLSNHTNAPLDQWDFTNVWHIQPNSYPVFSDEYIPQVYQIGTCEDLQNMRQDLQGEYELMRDIDCSQTVNWNNGAGFLPIASGRMEGFSGSLNGNGYTISNLTINRPDDYTVGLIEGLNGGYIYDFELKDAHITGSSLVGSLVGAAYNAGIFDVRVSNTSVAATNNAEGDVTQTAAGGLVGYFSTDLSGMYGMAQDSFTGSVTGIENVGGLAGNFNGAVIFDSYANATVSGRNIVGGLVGQLNLANIDNTYAAGNVSADGSDGGGTAGGLIGTAASLNISDSFTVSNVDVPGNAAELGNSFIGMLTDGNVSFSNDFYNVNSGTGACTTTPEGPVTDENCTGINLDEQPDYFFGNTTNAPLASWDFEGTWYMHANAYPTLRPLRSPEIVCEEVSGTSTSVNIACDSTPDGWGATTWEMQYQVSGTDVWTDVALPDNNHAIASITGLAPNTNYTIRFRSTNDWGTSEWGHIDYLTPDGNPVAVPTAPSLPLAKKVIQLFASPALASDQVAAVSAEASTINLDDFYEYTVDPGGKQLELSVGQVVYFMVGNEQHSATVKEIGADYVILTIASTPFDVRISRGETKTVSVRQSGSKDLSISLISTQNGKATLVFINPATSEEPTPIATTTTQGPTSRGSAWLLLLLLPALGYSFYRKDKYGKVL